MDQICCNRYMMSHSLKPQHRGSDLMCSGSVDGVGRAGLFLSETSSHPASNIPRSGFCLLNDVSIGPSLAAPLPFAPYLYKFYSTTMIPPLQVGEYKQKAAHFRTTITE